MKKFLNSPKFLLLVSVFVAVFASQVFGYGWKVDQFGVKFERKDGSYPIETWEWIDGDNSGNAYKYYFDKNGYRLCDTITPDYEIVDIEGRWLDNGELRVRKVDTMSSEAFANLLMSSGNTDAYEDYATKTIISNGLSIKDNALIQQEEERKRLERLRASKSEIIIGAGVKIDLSKKDENGGIISGRPYFVDNILTGEKYTKNVKSIKIYSGSVWHNVMSLNGDSSYIEFENGNYNRVIGKIAHGYFSSVTDTECKVNAYVDGILIATFEDFNYKTAPETVEFYFPTTTKKIRLEAEVSGSSTTRKIYLKDFRFKLDRTVNDDELRMDLEGMEQDIDDSEISQIEESEELEEKETSEKEDEEEPEENSKETTTKEAEKETTKKSSEEETKKSNEESGKSNYESKK